MVAHGIMGMMAVFPANYTNNQFRPSQIAFAMFGSNLTVNQIKSTTVILSFEKNSFNDREIYSIC